MTVVYNSDQTRGKGRIKRGEGGGMKDRRKKTVARRGGGETHTPTSPAHTNQQKLNIRNRIYPFLLSSS